ncbi:hypothetical protein [Chloroflexus sp.]|uniref:hypothetical protein n=1 Tax=Chloroflexus sp. TaxID=1904827 RepID=UPI002ACEBA88|nr:hypothetical protein [Chloroflexus sp.]
MSRSYRLSPAGRRNNLLMIAVTMLLWVFALWSFASTLRLSLHPAAFWSDLQRVFAQPPAIERAAPALLLFVLIVATPLLIWNLIAEWDAAFTLADEGLTYEAIGVRLWCPWEDVLALRPSPAVADEAIVIACRRDPAETIANPLLRWLHRQAHGRQRLVIGPDIEHRDELVAQIEQAMARTQGWPDVLAVGHAPSA